jgi:hypothetical protein
MYKIGDAKWQKIQDLHDEILELDRDSKKLGFRQLSAEEIIQNEIEEARTIKTSNDESEDFEYPVPGNANVVESDTTEEVVNQQEESDDATTIDSTEQVIPEVSGSDSVEVRVWFNRQRLSIFTRKITEWAGGRYLVLTELGVRGLRYDLVLRSTDESRPDILIEVKNYAAMDGFTAAVRSIFDYSVMNQIYEGGINRRSRTIYFLTTQSREMQYQLVHRLESQSEPNASSLSNIAVILMTERQFASLQPFHLDYVLDQAWGVVMWNPQSFKGKSQSDSNT